MKNILEDQQQFIRLMDEYEIDIFRIDDIELTLDHKFSNLNEKELLLDLSSKSVGKFKSVSDIL